ncbi:hypothetical protein SAMN04490370_102129 [Eubacterium ruminantium]|nr:hypothetical protein SAMN04490370_102129 [Eubacterium ruminantium]
MVSDKIKKTAILEGGFATFKGQIYKLYFR